MAKNLIIIGGGASGIVCAIRMKQLNPNINVKILEKNDRIGKKILKTGNGRCNISNIDMMPKYYNNQDFIKKCYSKLNPTQVNDFFRSIGLLIKNDEGSTRLYPYSESVNTVLEVFRYELDQLGIEVLCNHQVLEVIKKDRFQIKTNNGTFDSDYLVMATGSIAQEKTNGYQIVEALNHHITSLKPGLVPLKTKENLKSIQGIRVTCLAKVINNNKLVHQEEGEILFKEQGLSGVLTLNLSRYAEKGSKIVLDLFPNRTTIENEIKDILKYKDLEHTLLGILPKMLVYEVFKRTPSRNIDDVISSLRSLEFIVEDNYGYDQAQITIGGAELNEINDDFSSRKVNNLYIIGELLDIDGSCGGYNLHFAWVSGIIAALSINLRF